VRGLVAAIALFAAAARANGAFPDEFSIHFPAGSPHRILVGANFGLLVSEDDGATWRYSCEPYVTSGSSAPLSGTNVYFYQVTPDGAILANSDSLTRSADVGCTWPTSGGSISGALVADVFPDPNDASFVLAVVAGTSGSSIVASHDGGKTFDAAALYTTPDLLKGIEIARSKPAVLYATRVAADGTRPALLKSTDRGANWTEIALAVPAFTAPRILAVDPADADIVYLRLYTGTTDSIVITVDGGQTFQTALTVAGAFTSFLRATDGALYAGMVDGALYVRALGESTFAKRDGPRFRCLGQKPGTSRIYACGDMLLDGFSLATTDDGGRTFQRVMKFTELLGPLSCSAVQVACAAHWERIQQVLGIAAAPDAGPAPDAGSGPPVPPPAKSGCATAGISALAMLLVAAFAIRVRYRGHGGLDKARLRQKGAARCL
jgi:photosystem II stability/assembly factor-like uncharacterized protein